MDALLALVLGFGVVMLYFLPFALAKWRKHPASDGILVVNLLLGWTVLGWIVALAWAGSRPPPK